MTPLEYLAGPERYIPPRFPLLPSKLGKAEAITKTQARRPRYRMTGITTLTGRFSSAVGTTHDASKVIPCIVILLLAAKPPSPEVVHDKAPVPPGSVFLYDHIDPSWPMMFRIASCCQLPASRPAPGLHARKGVGQMKKTYDTKLLFLDSLCSFQIT